VQRSIGLYLLQAAIGVTMGMVLWLDAGATVLGPMLIVLSSVCPIGAIFITKRHLERQQRDPSSSSISAD
jgi:hypothetical protein